MERIENHITAEQPKLGKEKVRRVEKDFLPEREWNEQEKIAIKIIEKINEAGHEAYIAGGAVRDYVRGNEAKDIDITTSASSETIRSIFEGQSGFEIYYKSDKAKENKIINIKAGDIEFEVATFRKDIFLEEQISEDISMIEEAGFSKLLIESEKEYEDLVSGVQEGEALAFLGEEEMRKIIPENTMIAKGAHEGTYVIKAEEGDLEVAFYKIKSKSENRDGSQEEERTIKKQKHVPGRHPDFTLTRGVRLEDDAARRDFTMNGLYYDPVNKKIIDTVGGIEDIENKIIRFIGEAGKRIGEDQMRIIRFFRFKGDMEFEEDEKSLEAVRNWISNEDTAREFESMFCLSQRLKQELGKIFKSERRVEILDELENEGVMGLILPEVAKMKGVEQPKEFHAEGDVWDHTKACLKNLPEKKYFHNQDEYLKLVWATILHDAGKPETREAAMESGAERIHFNNHEKRSVEIARHVLLIEKEAKKYRGEGLNAQGGRLKGLNYDLEFSKDVIWLVENGSYAI